MSKSVVIFTESDDLSSVFGLDAGAVFDLETANGAAMRQALRREVWRHNNRSVAAATSPQLFVYDTVSDMSRQFQLSKSRT